MGHTGIPLAYVTREHVNMPEDRRPVELDLGLHMPTTPDEMIRRADTSAFGYGAAIVQETGDTVSVTPFDKRT